MSGQILRKSSHVWPLRGHLRSNLVMVRHRLVESGQDFVEVGPGEIRAIQVDYVSTLVGSGRVWAKLGRNRAVFGRSPADLVEPGRFRAKIGRIRAALGRAQANTDRSRAKASRNRSSPDQIWSTPGQFSALPEVRSELIHARFWACVVPHAAG